MRKGIKIETYIFEKTGVFSTVRHPKIPNRENAIATSINLCNVLPDNIVPHGNTEVALHLPRGRCDEPLKSEKLWINSSGEKVFSMLTIVFR